MTEFSRRYGRLSDHLYKFIANMASAVPYPDWGEREDIEMALKFIKRLEDLQDPALAPAHGWHRPLA